MTGKASGGDVDALGHIIIVAFLCCIHTLSNALLPSYIVIVSLVCVHIETTDDGGQVVSCDDGAETRYSPLTFAPLTPETERNLVFSGSVATSLHSGFTFPETQVYIVILLFQS